MAKSLNSLGALAQVFTKNTLNALVAAEAGLARAAKIVQEDAQDRIGHYQNATGPFQEWSPLTDATEAEKARLGYPANAPLLREGSLRDSIVTEHGAMEAIVGSKSPVAAYQEFGTDKIPPRPFIGPAAFANQQKIQSVIGSFAVAGLVGNEPVRPSLGYDFKSQKAP